VIFKQDYSQYLSIDNGKGLLLNKNDVFVLEQFGINYFIYSNMKDLILVVSNYIDDHYGEDIEELEEVLEHLIEMHYYYEVKK